MAVALISTAQTAIISASQWSIKIMKSSITATAPQSASGTMNNWKPSHSTGTIRLRSYCRSATVIMPSLAKPQTAFRREKSFLYPQGLCIPYTPPPGSNGVRFVYLLDLSVMTHLKAYAGIQPLLSTPFLLTKENSPDIYKDIFDLLMQMQVEYFRKNLYSELTVYSLLMTMFVKLGTDYSNKLGTADIRAGKQRKYLKQFNDLLAYIDDHYMDALTLESMASLMGFTKFHFSRLFKNYTGYTFCDYLNYRRIKATEELLPHVELPITEIAMQVGFSSISTFNRLFRVYKKCSPSEYRSKLSVHTFKKG